jgi:DnaK suppressor protein
MKQKIDLEQARKHLQEERKKLLDSLKRSDSVDQVRTGLLSDPDMEEQAAISTALHLHTAMRGYTEIQLARIDKAMERLKLGKYGKCVKCGKDITPGRLRAIPYVERCIQCQSNKEDLTY